MSEKSKSELAVADEFNLKHRITGAAVLLFFGALVIPWLLGPPSEASKQVGQSAEVSNNDDISARDIENELLGGERVDQIPEETVYISKITPLDGAESNSGESANGSADQASDALVEQVTEKETPTQVESDKTTAGEDAAAIKPEKSKDDEKPATKSVSREDQARKIQAQREKELQSRLEAESQSDQALEARRIQVGWVVQVGLYTEKDGANKKMAELRKQGFAPQSTIVDTNRGPRTGTRVWLGPFQKRPDAEAKNTELKRKTTKDGFIRVYP